MSIIAYYFLWIPPLSPLCSPHCDGTITLVKRVVSRIFLELVYPKLQTAILPSNNPLYFNLSFLIWVYRLVIPNQLQLLRFFILIMVVMGARRPGITDQ